MCSSLCPVNYYYVEDQIIQYYCKSCDSSCFRCTSSSASDCTKCNKNNTGYEYFEEISSGIGKC